MKKILFLVVFTTSIIFAQKPITYNLGNFKTIKVYSGLKVELHKAEHPRIEIIGTNADAVIVKNVNGVLKTSVKLPKIFSTDNVKISIYYTGDLDVIDANEGSVISASSSFNQNRLEVRAQEGSFIELPIETNYLDVKSVTGSQIILSGTSKNQNVETNTGGKYDGFDLNCDNTIISATTGSEVKIKSTNVLDCNVKLGGSILYKGSPKNIKSKIILGGSVNSAE